MKVGLYFGSFNPIHIGHVVLANHMLEFTDLDAVWFIVSPQNPFKKKSSLLDEHQRLHLVRLAIEHTDGLSVNNVEFSLPKPSYTIDTLTYLQEKYPSKEFSLIMGADNLKTLPKWKNYEAILKYYHVYVYPRPGYDGGTLAEHESITMTDAPIMEISSTFIRNAIQDNKDVGYLVPKQVWNYIQEMNFYKKQKEASQ